MGFTTLTPPTRVTEQADEAIISDLVGILSHVSWVGDNSLTFKTREDARKAAARIRKHVESRVGVPVASRTWKASGGFIYALRAKSPVERNTEPS